MQISIVTLSVALTSIVSGVAARNCNKGSYYCGHHLLRVGDYWQTIVDELASHGQHGAEMNALFACGSNGEIHYIQMCATCEVGGMDYCA